jgi:TonB-linked SusC/RagA family outer membrane protein
MKYSFLRVVKLLLCIAMVLPAGMVKAQTTFVKGRVTGEGGGPLAGVTVALKGTTINVITDSAGNFQLPANGGGTLEVSFVGHLKKTVTFQPGARLNIELAQDGKSMKDVVVVGYGTQRSREVTGAIEKISARSIRDLPVSTIGEAMAAQVAGVAVQQTTGKPGAALTIRVRGAGSISAGNDPLYVVDGYALADASSLNLISTADIASIEVLKDASAAAIYGSRGGNGVVIITTKKGTEGKPRYNFSYYTGAAQVSKKMDMLKSQDFVNMTFEAANNAYIDRGGDPSVPVASRNLGLNAIFYHPEQWKETDWQKQIFRTARMDNYQLSASGGNATTRYYLSGSYLNQEGVLKNTGFQRYSLRTNFDITLSPAVKVGINLAPAYSRERQSNTDGNYASTTQEGILMLAILTQPFIAPYQADGSYTKPVLTNNASSRNPLALLQEISDRQHTARMLGNLYMDVKILPGLVFRTSPGGDFWSARRDYFRPTTVPAAGVAVANGYQTTVENLNYIWENTLTYNHTFHEDHALTALVGYTSQYNRMESNRIDATGYPNDLVGNVNAATTRIGSSSIEEWTLASMLARINYSYKGKYLLTASIRRDGSSRFGQLTRWGTFPSVSAGWRLKDEGFLQNVDWLTELKLRASYGLTGNNKIANYGAIGLVTQENYVFGNGTGTQVSGLAQSTLSNPNLTWEKNKQTDIGLETGFFNSRVQLTADYYYRVSSDLLLNVPVPGVSGFTTSLRNIGEVENKGFEFTLNTHNLTGAFQWSTNINVSFNRNKVLSTGPGNAPIYAGSFLGNTHITKVGQVMGSFYGYKALGVFKDQAELNKYPHFANARPGDVKYADVSGNGVIDANDMTIIGNNASNYTYGITNTFTFKNFDLNAIMQGVQGGQIAHLFLRVYENGAGGGTNQRTAILNSWKSPSEPGDGVHPRLNATVTGNNASFSSRWVEDASYFRLRNVTLGYTLPARIAGKARMQSARIYVSGENLLTSTKYSGFNPEVGNLGDAATQPGVDYGVYPLNRIYTIGLNLGF